MRRLALPLIAVVLVAGVLGVQVAAGGGRYVPLRTANPCALRTDADAPIPARLEPLAAQIVLVGLDRAACRLGVSRERLVLALAANRLLNPREPGALRAGLLDAVNRLSRAGRLPRVSQLLPQLLAQANPPGLVKTLISAVPSAAVDQLLPTAPLLRRTIEQLDIHRLLHELNNANQLRSALQAAILRAVVREILDRLPV